METIYHDSSLKSGIYKIYNKLNSRIYIGSAKVFKDRYYGHLRSLRKNKHANHFLQNDFNKCGENSFVFEVIEVVLGNKIKRTKREQFHINQYYDDKKQCYNIKKDAIGSASKSKLSKSLREVWEQKTPEEKKAIYEKISRSLTGKKLSKEHIESMRKTKTGVKLTKKHKSKISKAMKNKNIKGRFFGHKFSEEKIKKIEQKKSLKMKGDKNPFYGKKHSKETIQKIKLANIGRPSSRKRKIKLTNLTTNEILVFESIKETCKFLQVTSSSVDRYIKNKRKHTLWKVEYYR